VRRPGNFTLLLIALLSFVLVPPFFHDRGMSAFVLPLLMSGVLLLGLNIFRQSRQEFFVACVFAVPALIGRWLLEFVQVEAFTVSILICWMVFLAFAVLIILRHILTTKRITYDTISGAICGYLLFGMMYAFVYAIIDFFYPGSLAASSARTAALLTSLREPRGFGHYIYFSFVTLASLGYGDITPISPPACAFSAIEGIAGQFYIAVLIARLVSLHSARWSSD
jgi:Ion channel